MGQASAEVPRHDDLPIRMTEQRAQSAEADPALSLIHLRPQAARSSRATGNWYGGVQGNDMLRMAFVAVLYMSS